MRNFSLFFVVIILFISANAQQSGDGTIHGKVVDVQGALVRGATVKITNASGAERTAQSNQDGEFSFNNLAAGKYSMALTARGFALYENAAIDIAAGKSLSVDVTLSITVNEKVTVGGEAPINTSPDANAGAIVLKGEDQITRLVARAVTRTVRVRSRQTSLT